MSTVSPPVYERPVPLLEDDSEEQRRETSYTPETDFVTPKRSRSRSLARQSEVPNYLGQIEETPSKQPSHPAGPYENKVQVSKESISLLRENLRRKFVVDTSEIGPVIGALEASLSMSSMSIQAQVAEFDRELSNVCTAAENVVQKMHELTDLSDTNYSKSKEALSVMMDMKSDITEMKRTPKSLAVRIMLVLLWFYTIFENIGKKFVRKKDVVM